jgi:hypothetical protein
MEIKNTYWLFLTKNVTFNKTNLKIKYELNNSELIN